MRFGEFKLIHWMVVLWPVPLILLAVALYVVKRKTGLQGWRRVVPGNFGAGITWIAGGVGIAIGFLFRRVLGKLPWKPILIWGPWVVILLVLGFHLEEHWRGARVWEKERDAWIARGESLDMADFMPEPILDEDNFVQHPAVLGELTASVAVAGPLKGTLTGFTSTKDDIWNGNPCSSESRSTCACGCPCPSARPRNSWQPGSA